MKIHTYLSSGKNRVVTICVACGVCRLRILTLQTTVLARFWKTSEKWSNSWSVCPMAAGAAQAEATLAPTPTSLWTLNFGHGQGPREALGPAKLVYVECIVFGYPWSFTECERIHKTRKVIKQEKVY